MEVVVAVVPMEVEAEAASTVAAVVVADSMEAVAEVMAAERIAAVAAERIAAVAVVRIVAEAAACIVAARLVTLLEAWVPMDAAAAACTAARVPTARTAGRVPMALTVAAAPTVRTEAGLAEARRRTRGTAGARMRGVRIL